MNMVNVCWSQPYRKYIAKCQIEPTIVRAEVRDTCHRVKHIKPNPQQNLGVEVATINFITSRNTIVVTNVAARACS